MADGMNKVYQEGVDARKAIDGSDQCPYGKARLIEQAWWKAGWHDMDLLMTGPRFYRSVRDDYN